MNQQTFLSLTLLPGQFSICQLPPDAPIPNWLPANQFVSITRTGSECSIVCPAEQVPDGVHCEPGWCILRLEGPFEFSLVGILLAVLAPLAEANVGIFAISTYDTDYVLVKQSSLADALAALRKSGHRIESN